MYSTKCNNNFHAKIVKRWVKIFSLKRGRKMWLITPSMSLFVLSRYLDPLPRYEDSKFSRNAEIMNGTGDPLTYIFFLETRILRCSRNRGLMFGIGQWGEERARGPSKPTRTARVYDWKLPFPLHDDISGTGSRNGMNEKGF